jgi:histidyl-tRNA synthetase
MQKLPSTPTRGMRDMLPADAELRHAVMAKILDVYSWFGFHPIETPAVENIALLTKGEGGENETLIFKILKRGEKLNLSADGVTEADIVDLGLRYDLTVPLSRYYANNAANLPSPFKSIQFGPVWRAERPGHERFRQFNQCDIDIIGTSSCIAEIELLLATSEALAALDFKGFVIRINDRRVLSAIGAACGFQPDQLNNVFIALDKLSKIGMNGVSAELQASGYEAAAIAKLTEVLRDLETADALTLIKSLTSSSLSTEVFEALERVISTVAIESDGRFSIRFDPTLVRGMSYYTGQIFEIEYKDYPFSIAGGGRYDQMIGKLLGRDVPACGFSIGFERIVSIIKSEQKRIVESTKRVAIILDSDAYIKAALEVGRSLRAQGIVVSLQLRQKKLRKQLDELTSQGFNEFCLVNAQTDTKSTDFRKLEIEEN